MPRAYEQCREVICARLVSEREKKWLQMQVTWSMSSKGSCNCKLQHHAPKPTACRCHARNTSGSRKKFKTGRVPDNQRTVRDSLRTRNSQKTVASMRSWAVLQWSTSSTRPWDKLFFKSPFEPEYTMCIEPH